MSKVSSINLYDTETKTEKFDIEVSQTRVDITVAGSQHIRINPELYLVDAVDGDISSVSQKLHTLDSAIASGNAGSAVASTLVQSNLDTYITSSTTAIGQVVSDLATEVGIRTAGQTSDSVARQTMLNDLTVLITAEETRAVGVEGVLTSSIATEVSNRITDVTTEASTRASADTTLQSQIDTEKARVDAILSGSSVNLDSFLEVVNAYSAIDSSTLATIATLQSQVNSLQSTVDDLTA